MNFRIKAVNLITLSIPFNNVIWLDNVYFSIIKHQTIFLVVILHNINDSPMRVEEELVAFNGIEEGV